MINKIAFFIYILTFIMFPQTEIRKDFSKFFDEQNVEGSIVVYDLDSNIIYYHNKERCYKRFSPASTFKIMTSLIALETKVTRDANFSLRWDAVKRDRDVWNKDQSLSDAFKNSTFWFYQELARRIGNDRMKLYIDKVGYGNKDISGGIDQFWLTGGLRISQMEQVQFLRRLYNNQLPFSQRTMDIVKRIMISERTKDYLLRSKTGLSIENNMQIGWWVGWYEINEKPYFFAINIETKDLANPNFNSARLEITKAILKELQIIPE
ncbi:MAG: class D beta-lactamase [Chlorobiaceae bacterium]|nr:class D beta-lactamase [Chlorobiaceae bacterium]MBA4309176.1 class D beta-lactamase [Chlorobiaceae bacterium]